MPYSALTDVKRYLIDQTLRVLEGLSLGGEVMTELKRWVEPTGPMTTLQKMQFCAANGFPASMALDSDFSTIIEQANAQLNFGAIPVACPRVLLDGQFAGLHAFVRHSDCEGDYSKGQCVDISDWLQFLAANRNKCEPTEWDELVQELTELFSTAVCEKQCVRVN